MDEVQQVFCTTTQILTLTFCNVEENPVEFEKFAQHVDASHTHSTSLSLSLSHTHTQSQLQYNP